MVATYIYLLGALIVAVFAILTLVPFRQKSRRKGDAILLLGPSDSGKTRILSSLAYQQSLPTHTSLQINESQMKLESSTGSIKLVDVPGHPRIRAQFANYLPETKGIVFVVDSSTIARNSALVAEHLHAVLHAVTQLPPSAYIPPILIYANKSDLISVPTASSSNRQTVAADRVRTILERELEKRRQSSLSGVGVTGLGDTNGEDESQGSISGGLECMGEGGFAFNRWEGGEITCLGGATVTEGSEKSIGGGSESLTDWLEGL